MRQALGPGNLPAAGVDRLTAPFPHWLDELRSALGDRYAFERELGRGGMGSVFLARDLTLDRPVAIKVLPPELAVRPELRQRFIRETRMAAGFSHPHIVPVHAVEERGPLLCLVMGYVDGETLTQRVRRAGPLNAFEAVRLLQEVAWALSYAHGRGVIHRDVKPDNILIERATGRGLVTDFGIARSTGAAPGLTAVGEVVGTPHFMSPEQAAGEALDGRSDLYSLGVVAFFALTGTPPFEAETAQALLALHLTRPAPPLAPLRPDLPAALVAAVERCLAKNPAERYANGEALVEALDPLRSGWREVAPAIRSFRQEADLSVLVIIFAALLLPFVLKNPLSIQVAAIAGLVLAWPWGFFLQLVGRARFLVKEGFRFEEVREGMLALEAEREAARIQLRASPEAMARRRRRSRASSITVVIALANAGNAITTMHRPLPDGSSRLSRPGILIVMASAMTVALALVFLLTDPTRASPLESLLGKLWTGPLGRWFFRLAGWRLGAAAGSAGSMSAPVMAEARGLLTVLESLPPDLRRRLPSARHQIEELERQGKTLAAREAALGAALLEAGQAAPGGGSEERRQSLVADLQVARDGVRKQRAALSGVLENLRLQLVRVKSGLGGIEAIQAELEATGSPSSPEQG